MTAATHYNKPGKSVAVFNSVAWMGDRGITLAGARTLEVRGSQDRCDEAYPGQPVAPGRSNVFDRFSRRDTMGEECAGVGESAHCAVAGLRRPTA